MARQRPETKLNQGFMGPSTQKAQVQAVHPIFAQYSAKKGYELLVMAWLVMNAPSSPVAAIQCPSEETTCSAQQQWGRTGSIED
jgi:hypothetical protein